MAEPTTPPTPGTGRGAKGQFFPDAQGNYNTGNAFFNAAYKQMDADMVKFLAHPEVAKLIASGGSGTVNKVIGDSDVMVVNGQITKVKTGGVWKPLLAAGAVAATGGLASVYVGPSAAATAATTGTTAATTTAATTAATTTAATTAATGIPYASLAARYALPVAGQVINNVMQNRAAKGAADEERGYLEQALAYQKESDLYNRGVDQAAIAKEENRYAGYQGRIKGFVDNGQSSNDRMASLLGLPARTGGSGGGGGGGGSRGGTPTDTGEWESWFKSLTGGRPPTPDELTKLTPQLEAAGASLAPNAAGVNGKIRLPGGHVVDVIEAAGAGGKNWQWLHDDIGQVTAAAPSATRTTQVQPRTTSPLASNPNTGTVYQPGASLATAPPAPAALITVTAPDGRTKQVPASEADHWKARGATIQGAA
jgi:hypothetical protein